MSVWPPPPKMARPVQKKPQPESRSGWSIVFAFAGTLLPIVVITGINALSYGTWLQSTLDKISPYAVILGCPALLLLSLLLGIKTRNHWLGIVGLVWASFALAFWAIMFLPDLLPHARVRSR
jgi:hypothetical protein